MVSESGVARVEGGAGRELAHRVEQFARRLCKGFGVGGGDDAAPGFDEHGIAQAGQRVADRRLREAEPRGGAADRPLFDDRQKQSQGVVFEVEVTKPLTRAVNGWAGRIAARRRSTAR